MREMPGFSLWLGHSGDLRNPAGLIEVGILAIVDLAGNEPPTAVPRELVYLRFPLLDGSGNPHWLLRAAVEGVAGLIRSGTATLVACGAGSSRSPAIAGAAVAMVRGCSLDEGLRIVTRSGLADVSPALGSDVRTALS
jgi:protein-tyrosine phosphatase